MCVSLMRFLTYFEKKWPNAKWSKVLIHMCEVLHAFFAAVFFLPTCYLMENPNFGLILLFITRGLCVKKYLKLFSL